MGDQRVGVLGAKGLVGHFLLAELVGANASVIAFSRQCSEVDTERVVWRRPAESANKTREPIPLWICVAPIWILADHFSLLESHGAKRVVALSSTSIFTKSQSSDAAEIELAHCLRKGEANLQQWAERSGVEWIVLRPTVIYGGGRDKSIAEIARFIRKFGFFPILGQGRGLRQPIHAADVAHFCLNALATANIRNLSFNISGGETLTYREMVLRVFAALQRQPRLPAVPIPCFKLAIAVLRLLPRYEKWSFAMAERMNQDLIFDHSAATKALGFAPRGFSLFREDVS